MKRSSSVARTNQIAAFGYVSRTNQITALGHIVPCVRHVKELG